MSSESEIVDAIKKSLTWIARATITLYVILILAIAVVFGVRINDLRYVDDIASKNQTALCAFRHDVEARIESSEQFLVDHPNGIPGISPAMIRTNITAQQQTVAALSVLECGGET